MSSNTNKIISELSAILEANQRVGLFMSGGMDSSLMAFLVHHISVANRYSNVFEVFVVPRTDNSVTHAKRIAKYIDDVLCKETRTPIHIVGDPTLHHSKQVISGITYALENHKNIDVFLNGANITPEELPGGPIRFQPKNPKVVLPFFNYTKDVLVQAYVDMGLTDLMRFTHTCTESQSFRCSECWQCRERAWAFKAVNFTDPGKM